MKDEFFIEILGALYQAQEEGYKVWIRYEGIEERITAGIDTVHVQSETFETDNESLQKGDINKITFLQRAQGEPIEGVRKGSVTNNQTIIIGIGLAGRNIVRYLAGIIPAEEIDCLVLDTDAADLKEIKDSKNIRTMLLGEPVCKGVGTQADVKKGEEAAVSHKNDIMDALKGYRKAAIVFGAGGGTGSGAGPEVYKIAREMGIETSVILTKPFSFEAKTRLGNTEECLDALLHENAEMIVFENEELRSLKNKDISLAAAFDVIHAKIAEHIKVFVSSGE